ncbi:hypothetical protein TWF569_011062 [Orbilia oligospora]|nr:hypothetical protein TWF706_008617 [Orbilia oligospora]KAF3131901.1 hypothetical protein TWF569_011062 [Orbilia oligospora]
MCLRIVEVYPVCLCVHHIHAVDSCRLAGQPGHVVEDRVLWTIEMPNAALSHNLHQYTHPCIYTQILYVNTHEVLTI